MSSSITKVSFKLILALAFLAASAGVRAGLQEELHSHEHKKNAPVAAHCDDPSAGAEDTLTELMPLAANGDAIAQFKLGFMYYRGNGVQQDYKEAASWYRKAAEQGNAPAQFYLGQMHDIGKGVPQDYQEASSWYRKAAEQGDAMAQLYLGFLYDHGQGVPVDMVQAYKWYSLAAVTGNEIAPKNKEIIAARMTKNKIKEAQAMADEWLAQHKVMHPAMKH